MVVRPRRPAVRRRLPRRGALRVVRVGQRRWPRGPASAAGPSAARRWGASSRPGARSRARSSPSSRMTAIRTPRTSIKAVGRKLGLGLVSLVNLFNPERHRDRRRRDRRRRAAARPGARGARRAGRCRSMRELARIVPARFGAEAGMLGAATLAFEELRGVSTPGRLRRLPDADRQPRGRDAARAGGAARRRRAGLRGHAHDEGAARPLRRQRRARALRRAHRAPRRAAARRADARR